MSSELTVRLQPRRVPDEQAYPRTRAGANDPDDYADNLADATPGDTTVSPHHETERRLFHPDERVVLWAMAHLRAVGDRLPALEPTTLDNFRQRVQMEARQEGAAWTPLLDGYFRYRMYHHRGGPTTDRRARYLNSARERLQDWVQAQTSIDGLRLLLEARSLAALRTLAQKARHLDRSFMTGLWTAAEQLDQAATRENVVHHLLENPCLDDPQIRWVISQQPSRPRGTILPAVWNNPSASSELCRQLLEETQPAIMRVHLDELMNCDNLTRLGLQQALVEKFGWSALDLMQEHDVLPAEPDEWPTELLRTAVAANPEQALHRCQNGRYSPKLLRNVIFPGLLKHGTPQQRQIAMRGLDELPEVPSATKPSR